MKPCHHTDIKLGCRICWLASHDSRYQALWGVNTPSFKERRKPCVYLGPVIDARPACGCGAMHECTKHGSCIRHGNHVTIRSCLTCADFVV